MDLKKLLRQIGSVGVIVAVIATAAFAVGYINMDVYVMLLGVGGFSGLAGLRAAIESSGYKTYIIAAGGIAVVVGFATGVVDEQSAAVLLAIAGIGSLPTLAHANKKAKT